MIEGNRRRMHDGKSKTSRVAFRAWRTAVQDAAALELDGGDWPLEAGVPVAVRLVFELPRPKSHYRTGRFSGVLRDPVAHWHTFKPDVDKLTRAILDALTGRIYVDDSQVAELHACKRYADDRPSTTIYAVELPSSGYLPFAGLPLELLAEGDLDAITELRT